MSEQTKYVLQESDMPKAWYNIQHDFATPLPPVIHPGTGQPIGPQDLAPLFPMELIMQEVGVGPYATDYVDIPEEVQETYKLWRPTPLIRARRLEKALDTPAHIYFKYEGVSPSGSHKPNTAVPQAYYNKQAGTKRITTETGAGQWGSALAFACKLHDIECKVYMVAISYRQKPYRRILMETYGASVVSSPSMDTNTGRKYLGEDAEHTGSLGLAISEAVEDAAHREDTKYSLGSVLNHVLLHQTVIGQEALKQMELAGEYPDIVVGCVGGGSNFGGIALPFVREKMKRGRNTRIIAVEPTAAPSLTKGIYTYDFGDTGQIIPLVKMYTLGSSFIPAPIHAGGLRYHGMSPIVCKLYDEGVIEAVAVPQNAVFESNVMFAREEGILPAPEPGHAIRVVIQEALKAKEEGEKKTILFNLCGHGHFDLAGYEQYMRGNLQDYEYPREDVERAIAMLPKVPAQYMENPLFEKIYALARNVPYAKVTTYGQLGAMVGLRDMRTVGDAMNACPADVPWQRVINSRGTISMQGATGSRQRALLEEEGVGFDENGQVDFAKVGWIPDQSWLEENGYKQPPPLVKEKKGGKGNEEDGGAQLSLF